MSAINLKRHARAVSVKAAHASLAAEAGDEAGVLKYLRDVRMLADAAIGAIETTDFARACEAGLVRCERVALLERLVSDAEPLFSSERDTRIHDSDSTTD
jgi:hypothetical protein